MSKMGSFDELPHFKCLCKIAQGKTCRKGFSIFGKWMFVHQGILDTPALFTRNPWWYRATRDVLIFCDIFFWDLNVGPHLFLRFGFVWGPMCFFWYTNIFLNRENGLCTTWTLHCTTWTLHKNQTRVDVDLDWVWITCEIYNKQMKKHMINKSLTHRGLGLVFRVWRRDHLWTTQIQKCFIYP